MLTLSYHNTALEFSKAKEGLQSPQQKWSNLAWELWLMLFSSASDWEGSQCQQDRQAPGGTNDGVGSGGFFRPREIGQICLWFF